jgi:hypothetical protein
MDLDDYVRDFGSNPFMTSPQSVNIRSTLARVLYLVRETAETEGVEYGRTLWYENGQIASGQTIRGEQTSVSLDTDVQATFDEYIGDFHVHPYRRKMSDTASIGFSTGDIETYLKTKRASNQVSALRLYIVVAGPKVWLIIIYPWTQKDPQGQPKGTGDVEAALEYIDKTGKYDRWHSGVNEMNQAKSLDSKIAAEQRMWGDIPGYPAIFAKANKQMNRNLAEWHQYGLYIGKFGDRDANTLQPILMVRKVNL